MYGRLRVVLVTGSNGRYWTVEGDGGVTADGDQPHAFVVELRRRSRLTIRSTLNGNYVSAEQNGCVTAKHADVDRATLWEY